MKSRKAVNNTSSSNRPSAVSAAHSELEEAAMNFPLDHLYACSTDTARAPLRPSAATEQTLTERLNRCSKQNKQLRELLLVNLDLVQQQSDRIVTKEKALLALKRENVSLKSKIERLNRRPHVARPSLNPPPLVHIPPPATKPKNNTAATAQVALNKYTELLITDIGPKAPSEVDAEVNKSQSLCYFPTEGEYLHLPEVNVAALLKENQSETKFLELSDVNVATILKDSDNQELIAANSTVDSIKTEGDRQSPVTMKKDTRQPRTASLPSSSSDSRSALTKEQRNERTKSQFYKSRNALPKAERLDSDHSQDIGKQFDYNFTVNKKSKMIHTYGKSSKKGSLKRLPSYTGSLSDRLKLMEPTPTGEDPYQLRDLDMREQSPIPKLMLQKSGTKAKTLAVENFANAPDVVNNLFGSPDKASTAARKSSTRIKSNKYNLGTPGYTYPGENDDSTDVSENSEAVGESEKPTGDATWPEFSGKDENVEVSCSDFSYGEKSRNLGSRMTFENDDYQHLFSSDSNFCPSDVLTEDMDMSLNDESAAVKEPKKRNETSRSLLKPKLFGSSRKYIPLRERMKRTMSTGSAQNSKWSTGSKLTVETKGENQRVLKRRASEAPAAVPGGGGGGGGAHKSPPPPPPMTVSRPYHTTCGDSECAWYAGRDPDSDTDEAAAAAGARAKYLEVPRWREKPYTSLYSLEGTENLDDEVFNKRHHKREVDERRRKRWDIQRIREQLNVERLRQKQPDAPWYDRSSRRAGDSEAPPLHTLWPLPRRSVQYLEITDDIPVSAFGDIVPALPERDFVLPWIMNTRPFKRAKYSKKPKIRDGSDKEYL